MGFVLKKEIRKRRVGLIKTGGKKLLTPYYFPTATVGAVKGIGLWELKKMGFAGILANTYHLYLRPGQKFIKKTGGLHKWLNWEDIILTDSGGYQVFSLGLSKNKKPLVKITQRGVEFKSHLDGSKHFFTPEKVIEIQLDFKSDIIMPLDICSRSNTTKKEVEKEGYLTLEWLKRSKNLFDKKIRSLSKTKINGAQKLGKIGKEISQKSFYRPLLFGIIQGGTFLDLRERLAKETIKLNLDGYAIGGLSVGEKKEKMWKVIKFLDKILPKNKPRYLMGVGDLNDYIKAINLGIDLVDCVLPTRLGRHGIAYKIKKLSFKNPSNIEVIKLDLRKKWAKNSFEPLDEKCLCEACKNNLSISYLHHLIKEDEILSKRLLSLHNLATLKRINECLRE